MTASVTHPETPVTDPAAEKTRRQLSFSVASRAAEKAAASAEAPLAGPPWGRQPAGVTAELQASR